MQIMTKKRMALVPPRQTPWHYTLGCRCSRKPSDPPFPRRGSRVLEDKCSVWACTKPERFPIPYLHFMNNNIQGQNITLLSLLCHCSQTFKRPE